MVTFLPNLKIESFGFVEREKDSSGASIKYRCGRDFLYYALHYHHPDKFNPKLNNPAQIERDNLFGLRLPWWLMWTQLQFKNLPSMLSALDLELAVNGARIGSSYALLKALSLPGNMDVQHAIREVQKSVDQGQASAIDISLGLHGLIDHVLFVYGYDESNLYVFDTHQVRGLEYQKMDQANGSFYMRLPKEIVIKRWSNFGRYWTVRKKA